MTATEESVQRSGGAIRRGGRGRHARDEGSTFIEAILAVTIIGIVVAAIAIAFSIVVRVTPAAQARTDDARSTRGLATWLSHDAASVPPYDHDTADGWIDTSASAGNECGGAGSNLARFEVVERGATNRTFVTSYRFVVDGAEGRIVRSSCELPVSTVRTVTLASELDPSTPPQVTLDLAGGEVVAVDVVLTVAGGEQVVVTSGSRNPVESFP